MSTTGRRSGRRYDSSRDGCCYHHITSTPSHFLPSQRLSATLTRQQCAFKDLNFAYSPKAREARGTESARPGYLKRKNHASMPHLGQVLKQVPRPATYADEVNSLRHPPRSPPKRSQSLDDYPMAGQKETKHVHFVDEGYGSSATSPATSPKVSRNSRVAWLPLLTSSVARAQER